MEDIMARCGRCGSEYSHNQPLLDSVGLVLLDLGMAVPEGVSPDTLVCSKCVDKLVNRLSRVVKRWSVNLKISA